MTADFATADAARLAARVSMAPRVTPALLRHQRLALRAPVGVEADVWFSSGVAVTSPEGFEWRPDVAEHLRRELLRREGLAAYDAAWDVTRRALVHADVTARVEAELTMLETLVDPAQAAHVPAERRAAAAARIEELLRVAVRALVRGGRSGMAYWVARLLPRLPEHVRARDEASMLDAGSSLKLHSALPASLHGRDDELPAWLAEAAPDDLPRVTIAVERRGEALLLGHVEALSAGVELSLPDTTPLVVEVRGVREGKFTRVSWDRAPGASDEPEVVTVGDGAVLLRTLLGEEYDLSRVEDLEDSARAAVLDQSEYAALHRPFFGPSTIDIDKDLRPGVYFELVGERGVGKTAQVVRVIDELVELRVSEPWIVAWHLVRDDVPEWCDVDRVCASLAAQIVAQRPALDDGRTRRGRDALMAAVRAFDRARTGDERVFIVLDTDRHVPFGLASAMRSAQLGSVTIVTARRFSPDSDEGKFVVVDPKRRELKPDPDVWRKAWFGDETFASLEKEINSCSTWADARIVLAAGRSFPDNIRASHFEEFVWGEGEVSETDESTMRGEEEYLAALACLNEACPKDVDSVFNVSGFVQPANVFLEDTLADRLLVRRAAVELWLERSPGRTRHGHERIVALLREVTPDSPWLHDYARRHLIHHATEVEDDDVVVELLTSPSFLRARADAGEIHEFVEQVRAWYEVRGVARWESVEVRRRRSRHLGAVEARDVAKSVAQRLPELAHVIGTHDGAGDRAIDLIFGGLMTHGFTRDEIASSMPDVRGRPLLRLAGRAMAEDEDAWARARAAELLAEGVQVETAGEWFVVRTRRGQVVATRSDETVAVLTQPDDVVVAMAVSPSDGPRHVTLAFGHADGRVTIHEGVRADGMPDQGGWQRARGYHTGEAAGVAWITDDVFATWDDTGELTARDVAKGALEGWDLGAPVTAFGSGADALVVGTDDGVIAVLRGTAGDGAPVAFLDTRPGRAPIEPRTFGEPTPGRPTATHWARATAHRSAIVGAAVCGDVVLTAEREGDVIVHRIEDGERVDGWRDHGTAAVRRMSSWKHPIKAGGNFGYERDDSRFTVITCDAEGSCSHRLSDERGVFQMTDRWHDVPPCRWLRRQPTGGHVTLTGRRAVHRPFAKPDAETRTIALHDHDILDAAWMPRDHVLATVSLDDSLRVWNPDGEQLARFGPPTHASPAIARGPGHSVVTRRGRDVVVVHAERVEQELARIRSVEATHWDVAPYGRWMTAIGNGRWVLHDLEHAVESAGRKANKGNSTTGWSHRIDLAAGCALSMDGRSCVAWTRAGDVVVRDTETGRERARWHVDGVVDVVGAELSLHDQWFLLTDAGGYEIRKVGTDVPIDAPRFGEGSLRGIVPGRASALAWTARAFGILPAPRLGHEPTGEVMRCWPMHHPMDPMFALLADGSVAVSTREREDLVILRTRGARVVDAALVDAATLATLQSDGRLTLWDLADGSEISIAVVPAPAAGLVSHTDGSMLTVVDAVGGLSSFTVALDERDRPRAEVPRIAVLAAPAEAFLANQYADMLRGQSAAVHVGEPDARTTAIHALVDGVSMRDVSYTQRLLRHARDFDGPALVVLLLDEPGDAAWRDLSKRYALTTVTRTIGERSTIGGGAIGSGSIGGGRRNRGTELRDLQRAAVALAWGIRPTA